MEEIATRLGNVAMHIRDTTTKVRRISFGDARTSLPMSRLHERAM